MWCEERNKSFPEQCPENLLKEPNAEVLNYWLLIFVVEVHRKDGKPYPPATINNILSGLYRFCKSSVPTGVICPNFMDRKDPHFRDLTGAIQVRYREQRTEEVHAIVKHAAVVTPEEEALLCNSKVLGMHSPLALIRLSISTTRLQLIFMFVCTSSVEYGLPLNGIMALSTVIRAWGL